MRTECGKCGRQFAAGELRYHVRIDILSLFDGYLPEPADDIDAELERLIEAVSRQNPDDVAKDVAQTIELTVCRECRNRLVRDYDIVRTPEMVH